VEEGESGWSCIQDMVSQPRLVPRRGVAAALRTGLRWVVLRTRELAILVNLLRVAAEAIWIGLAG
jgi:hypothetical protein